MFDIRSEIILITMLSAIAAAMPGAFIVLKGDYPSTDVTAKSSTLGFVIVLLFFSGAILPVQILAGALAGFVGYYITLKLSKISKIDHQFFEISVPNVILALSVALISIYNIPNIDVDTILFGELALLPFDRLAFNMIDYGSIMFYILLLVFLLNAFCVLLFYRSFTSLCIDAEYGGSIRLNMSLANTLLAMTSAFSMAVMFYIGGAIMMISLVLAPAVIAYYYTSRPSALVITSIIVSIVACLTGFSIAYVYKQPIVPTFATVIGFFVMLTVIFAPEKGIIQILINNKKKKQLLNESIILIFMAQDLPVQQIDRMSQFLKWKQKKVQSLIEALAIKGLVLIDDHNITLTEKGVTVANDKLYKAC